jgi:hypothetical protein
VGLRWPLHPHPRRRSDNPLVPITLHLSEVQLLLDTLAVSSEQSVVFMSNCRKLRRLQARLVRSKHAMAVRIFNKLCTALNREGHQPKLVEAPR